MQTVLIKKKKKQCKLYESCFLTSLRFDCGSKDDYIFMLVNQNFGP